jgi:hypothetical protein
MSVFAVSVAEAMDLKDGNMEAAASRADRGNNRVLRCSDKVNLVNVTTAEDIVIFPKTDQMSRCTMYNQLKTLPSSFN